MPTEQDLFAEEQSMATMSFGDHIEELRVRLILALLGLVVGVIVVFLPPIYIAAYVMQKMEEPAKKALEEFYREQYNDKVRQAQEKKTQTPPLQASIPADELARLLKEIFPQLPQPDLGALKEKSVDLPMRFSSEGMIRTIETNVVQIDQSIISLGPLETIAIYFMVALISGLVLASPWVFYQGWAFVAAGLYRHERAYVKKFLPFSLGLFLTGVFLCFFLVIPITLQFLLQFNVKLGVAPTLRLSEWMSFATLLPLIFGLTFQTPLVMLILERLNIFTVEDFRAKRKFAILIITIAAALLTPGQDPFSMVLLALPMVLLYELGILMIAQGKGRSLARVTS
jgi:sec-independent protein translocase protein TatC